MLRKTPTPTPGCRDMLWPRRLVAAARAAVALAGLLAVSAGPAEASHPKIDRVELANGDVLTCEIIRLVRGKLTVKTDALGTVSIEWEKISRVSSPVPYEVELSSGTTEFGALSSPAVTTLVVGQGVPVPYREVIRFVPIESGLWRRLDGSIAVGYSYTEANNRTQWTLDTSVTSRWPKFVANVSFDSLIATEDVSDQESRQTLSISLQRSLARRWFSAALGQFSRNQELGLDYRSATGGGIGRWLIQTQAVLLTSYAGLAYTRERYVDQSPENRAEVLAGFRWDWFTFGDHDFDLTFSTIAFMDVQNGNRMRAEIDGAVSRKIVKDLKVSISLFESFNSAPPAGEKKSDFGVTLSIGWTF